MPSIEILEGLKQAVIRGESLDQAKLSFLNAGYSQAEIDEASSLITSTPSTQIKPVISAPIQKPLISPNIQRVSNYAPTPTPIQKPLPSVIPQPVSNYSSAPKKETSLSTIIVLSLIFLILLIVMGVMIFFKQEFINFLNTLFGK